jgi:hypothetical protein
MLDLGFDIASRTRRVAAPDDPALHVAIWRGRHATVRLLIERGASLAASNGRGEAPLAYAVRACTQSEWFRGATESVEALLRAGAPLAGLPPLPTGCEPLDELLRPHLPPPSR